MQRQIKRYSGNEFCKKEFTLSTDSMGDLVSTVLKEYQDDTEVSQDETHAKDFAEYMIVRIKDARLIY